MTLFGITLRRPTSTETTCAAVMATGLWVAAMGLLHVAAFTVDRYDAGALLIVILWGCVSVRLGIRVEQGHRHLLVNIGTSGVLLLLYQGAWSAANW